RAHRQSTVDAMLEFGAPGRGLPAQPHPERQRTQEQLWQQERPETVAPVLELEEAVQQLGHRIEGVPAEVAGVDVRLRPQPGVGGDAHVDPAPGGNTRASSSTIARSSSTCSITSNRPTAPTLPGLMRAWKKSAQTTRSSPRCRRALVAPCTPGSSRATGQPSRTRRWATYPFPPPTSSSRPSGGWRRTIAEMASLRCLNQKDASSMSKQAPCPASG